MVDYKLKLKALFHDPFDKQYIMWKLNKNHEEVAQEYFDQILIMPLEDDNIKIADQLASAISRIIAAPTDETLKNALERDTKFEWEEIKFIDIFSLKTYGSGKPNYDDEVKEVLEEIGKLTFEDPNERAKLYFLFLWRFIPEIFPWINTHPADSRAPNHSIYDHLVQTSAIVSCLPKPAFLLFTIGPVQEFIATARKTSDLWAGSYILSYLIYKAIEVILEELGPDNVIYPNLLGQPLVDRWLSEKFKNSPIWDTFKNEPYFKKFENNQKQYEYLTIANFPNKFLAIVPFNEDKNIAKQCKEKVLDELNNITQKLTEIENAKSVLNNNVKEMIKEHLRKYFQIYYVYLPWFNTNYQDVQTILEEYKDLVGENEIYKAVELIIKHPYYQNPNVGSAYSLLVEIIENFMASRKMWRNFEDIGEQRGEKCHLCGNYDILPIQWQNLEKEVVKESERLCGVCFTKRLFPKILKNILSLSEEVKFPSTSEMATILYKVRMDNQKAEEFAKKFNGLDLPKSKSVPKLRETPLYEIDGQWLFKESYRKEYLKREYGKEIPENELKNLAGYVEENFKGVPTYYAILMMDGDNIGKWLKGEMMPKVGELIHEKVKDALLKYWGDKKKEIYKLLCSRHPISASIHQNFSRKLTEFALNEVRKIVEEDHYGKLIYAGGDDLLAFLPAEEVLDCSYTLQRKFKDILSEKASMSAGIVIVHHKYPLALALSKAREAEAYAKGEYGKDAFCIIYLSRSGEERKTGGKWEIKSFFNELACLLKGEKISKGFAYGILETIEKIGDLNIVEIETKRILKRKLKKEIPREEKEKYIEKFIDVLVKYKDNLRDFANMLIIAERVL